MEKITRKAAEFDLSKLPVVIMRVTSIEPNREEFISFLEDLTKVVHENAGIVLIMDLTQAKFLSSELRIEAGNWTKRETETMKRNMKGLVFVNNSVMTSVILKGIFLVSKPPVDHAVVTTLEQALDWAAKK